jgi:hypothetical protein
MNPNLMRVLFVMVTAFVALPIPAHAQPPIPLLTGFSHWDHHWFMWTPRHPVYESIEVMSKDAGDGRPPLIWVFFTEREGRKKQVHYFNDPVLARRWPGDTHYRDIEYRTEGPPGAPRGLAIQFRDKDNAPVEWAVTFDAGAALGTTGAGLTDQSGHSSGSLFLIFFREKGASTSRSALRIGGRDFSFRDEDRASGRYRFGTAYSTNVFTATIAYSSTMVESTSDGVRTSTGWVFTKEAGAGGGATYISQALGDRNAIRVMTDAAGRVMLYEHTDGDHTFRIVFDPALALDAAPGPPSRYEMSLDGFARLVSGVAQVRAGVPNGVTIGWRNERPEWATAYRFTSILRPTAGQKYELVVAPTRD